MYIILKMFLKNKKKRIQLKNIKNYSNKINRNMFEERKD